MKSNTNNRSVMRTQALLKEGLTELMKLKPIQKISVKELTDYVNLNRGTFYLHYKDIYDLMEQLERDMLDEFLAINQTHMVADLHGKPFPLLLEFFEFFYKNKEFIHILLIENRDQHLVDEIKKILQERCLDDWVFIFGESSSELREFYCAYVLSGCIGMIEKWFREGNTQSPETIAQYTEDIILHGLDIFRS